MRWFVGRCALALLAVLLVAPAAWAQNGTVTGRVTSAETAAPLGGAEVSLQTAAGSAVSSALTDAAGQFRVANVQPGTYTVVVRMIGHRVGRTEGVRIVAGETTNVSMSLNMVVVELNPLQVSVGRRQERVIDAPARVEVVSAQQIAERPAVSPVDHLRNVPGIDIASSGVQSSNVVARGFNNVFSGALYALTDHRIAGVPSLRVNLLHMVPATNEDIEQIEVVLGPGSALYGPNTANGVLHMMTRSPLSSQGTSVSVAGGEQSLFQGTFRTAQLLTPNLGVKLSGQYLQAQEWEYRDPAEQAERTKFAANPTFWKADLMRATGTNDADASRRIGRIADRDFDISRWSGEARADWRVSGDMRAVFSVGSTLANGIELTGLGASQIQDWRYTYYQARASSGRFFGQVYLNTSDAGDTYLLRNGAPIVDRSKLLVGQLQHGIALGERQNFTYGADYLHTMPETDGTINGKYEDDDQTREFGAYLQSETRVNRFLDLVFAGRMDVHSELPNAIFSPRAALVMKPVENQVFRLTFNRAFSTPSSLNQFLDLGSAIPDANAAALGYSLRIQGTGGNGIRIRQPDGSYLMRSPFNQNPGALIPAQAAPFYPAAFQVVRTPLTAGLAAAGLPQPQVDAIINFLSTLRPTSQQLATAYLNPQSGQAGLLSQFNFEQVAPMRESTSTTFEVGYKGILGDRLLLAADLWHTKRNNLISPLTMATPFIRADVASGTAYFTQMLTGFFQAAGMPQQQAAAQAAALAPSVAGAIGQVPVGTISSAEINANGPQLLMTYFNVDDDVSVYGTDLSATALLTDRWSLNLSGSLVNRDVFTTRQGEQVTLNAPKQKGSVAINYRDAQSGLSAETRVRHTAGHPVSSGVYIATQCLGDESTLSEACIDPFTLVDVNLSYRLPMIRATTVQLNVQNLLDEKYRSFPGVPMIGRMAMLRMKYEF
jgi:outer membrane receptor for ferrienterochelin and colicins